MSTLSNASSKSRGTRLSFAKIHEPLPIDDLDLVAIQRDSFDWLDMSILKPCSSSRLMVS